MKTGKLSIPILLLAASGLAAPAAADWLVTREGARLETQGPWKVKGKLLVFTQPDGTLASLRLDTVDLPASEQATAEAKEVKENPPPPPEPVKRKSIVSLTDADFRKPEPPPAPPGTAPAPGKTEEPTEAAAQKAVVVQDWQQVESSEGAGLFITGTVENTVDALASGVELTVELFNEEKESLGTAQAVLSATTIRPGGTAAFRAAFPTVFTFAEARFNVVSRSVIVTPTPEGTDTATNPES